jgi:DNA-binding response OmpR family regulator
MARIRALLRRPQTVQTKVLQAQELALDLNTCKVTRCGEEVSLAPSEFALLELFMKNPGRLFSSKELLDRVFSLDTDATDEAVRQRILRLRKKIDVEGKESLIKTVKGLGYKFEMET